ncbi:MAG TPA: glycosyltransferase family 4 protein [Verrucomicrobiae bacterium]|nr:glycosyltransferase family 4 protein [Verrucomicrobiae bacterium]
MRVAHVLRKYNPAEWGGTETALQRLFDGLRPEGVTPVVFCPQIDGSGSVEDPFERAGYPMKRFRACVPIWGLPVEEKHQHIAVGGNLMSFDLLPALWRERDVQAIHSHTLGRLGGIGMTVARRRKMPFVVTIHGGVLDLPERLKQDFASAPERGWEWGKIFGLLLKARHVLDNCDAILTCNPREAALMREKYPGKRVQVQPHAVSTAVFERDAREAAHKAFPQIRGKEILLCVGRIDPVKNQGWLIEEMPDVLERHPKAMLVLAGACTDKHYGVQLLQRIGKLGLETHVLLTGGLPPGDPRLLGLFQEAAMVLLPSISETFGLVILEAWAAGAAPVSSRTSGARSLIQHGENGFLFDLERPASFHESIDALLANKNRAKDFGARGQAHVKAEFDSQVLARRVKNLYEELIAEKKGV